MDCILQNVSAAQLWCEKVSVVQLRCHQMPLCPNHITSPEGHTGTIDSQELLYIHHHLHAYMLKVKVTIPVYATKCIGYMRLADIFYTPTGTQWVIWSVSVRLPSLSQNIYMVPILGGIGAGAQANLFSYLACCGIGHGSCHDTCRLGQPTSLL